MTASYTASLAGVLATPETVPVEVPARIFEIVYYTMISSDVELYNAARISTARLPKKIII